MPPEGYYCPIVTSGNSEQGVWAPKLVWEAAFELISVSDGPGCIRHLMEFAAYHKNVKMTKRQHL